MDRVTVIDVEHGARLRNQRVLIVGNRIQALGPRDAVRVPPGARLVDARVEYLIPGLWDTHTHPSVLQPTPAAARRHAEAVYEVQVAYGITGIRDAGASVSLDTFRVWKREIAAGQRVGPRMIVSGPSINDRRLAGVCPPAAPSACQDSLQGQIPFRDFGHTRLIADAAEAPALVDSLKAAGADLLKFRDVPRPLWFALAREARRVGIPFGGHFIRYEPWNGFTPDTTLPTTVDGLVASDSGARILDHEPWADVCGWAADSTWSVTRCAAAAARLRRNHTWIAGSYFGADLSSVVRRAFRATAAEVLNRGHVWQPLSAVARRQRPTEQEIAAWLPDSVYETRGCQRARLAYAADMPWMPGPDYPAGSLLGVDRELLGSVLCGVPRLWVLQAATLNPARAFGLVDSLGTVAVGKVADLVLLEGDPLEDIWNVTKVAAVVANGRYFDRPALDRLLTEASAELLRLEAQP